MCVVVQAFENIGIFLLPHPGLKLTKKNYDGDIKSIEESFLKLLDVYVRRIFEENLNSKRIQGVDIAAANLEL